MYLNRLHEKKVQGGEEVGVGGRVTSGGGLSALRLQAGTAEPRQWAGKTFIHRVHGNRSLPGESGGSTGAPSFCRCC